jgi:hypothetical protein
MYCIEDLRSCNEPDFISILRRGKFTKNEILCGIDGSIFTHIMNMKNRKIMQVVISHLSIGWADISVHTRHFQRACTADNIVAVKCLVGTLKPNKKRVIAACSQMDLTPTLSWVYEQYNLS